MKPTTKFPKKSLESLEDNFSDHEDNPELTCLDESDDDSDCKSLSKFKPVCSLIEFRVFKIAFEHTFLMETPTIVAEQILRHVSIGSLIDQKLSIEVNGSPELDFLWDIVQSILHDLVNIRPDMILESEDTESLSESRPFMKNHPSESLCFYVKPDYFRKLFKHRTEYEIIDGQFIEKNKLEDPDYNDFETYFHVETASSKNLYRYCFHLANKYHFESIHAYRHNQYHCNQEPSDFRNDFEIDMNLLLDIVSLSGFELDISFLGHIPNSKAKTVHQYDLLKVAIANNNFYLIEGLLNIGACPFQDHYSLVETCFEQLADKDKDLETSLAVLKLFKDYGWFNRRFNILYLCEKLRQTLLAAINSSKFKLIEAYLKLGVNIDNRYEINSKMYQKYLKTLGQNSALNHVNYIHRDGKTYGEIFKTNRIYANGHTYNLGMSPLMILITKRHDNLIPMAEFLIKNGADVNLCDEKDISVLDYACYTKNMKLIKDLLLNKVY